MTDFYSQNRCVCSTRSHGPLLCAFCLSFHFNMRVHPIGIYLWAVVLLWAASWAIQISLIRL